MQSNLQEQLRLSALLKGTSTDLCNRFNNRSRLGLVSDLSQKLCISFFKYLASANCLLPILKLIGAICRERQLFILLLPPTCILLSCWAYMDTQALFKVSGRSLVNTDNNNGPSWLLCGTPHSTKFAFEASIKEKLLCSIRWVLSILKAEDVNP